MVLLFIVYILVPLWKSPQWPLTHNNYIVATQMHIIFDDVVVILLTMLAPPIKAYDIDGMALVFLAVLTPC